MFERERESLKFDGFTREREERERERERFSILKKKVNNVFKESECKREKVNIS